MPTNDPVDALALAGRLERREKLIETWDRLKAAQTDRGVMTRANAIERFASAFSYTLSDMDGAAATLRANAVRIAALEKAIDDFVHAYRARYRKGATDGLRSNAPLRSEAAALNSARQAAQGVEHG